MSRVALLAAAAAGALCAFSPPASAEIDPPTPRDKTGRFKDARVRVVTYDRDNPTVLVTAAGASIAIEFGADETIEKVVASDQGTWAPEDEFVAPDAQTVADRAGGGARQGAGERMDAGKSPASCDPNMCRSASANFLYLKPLRQLDPQPLHVLTKRCVPGAERCEMVPYAFKLTAAASKDGDPRAAVESAAWDVRFVYPGREHAARAARWRAGRAERAAEARERADLAPPPPALPQARDNRRYGYRGSAAVMPDPNGVWDDGRTTFLRFSGNRRVPNLYRELPGGVEGTTPYAVEADAAGVTILAAGVAHKWIVRDGDETGCVFPEPSGLFRPGVATIAAAPITGDVGAGPRGR